MKEVRKRPKEFKIVLMDNEDIVIAFADTSEVKRSLQDNEVIQFTVVELTSYSTDKINGIRLA